MNVGLVIALLLFAAPASPLDIDAGGQPPAGIINGALVDDTGAAIAGATITLSHDGGLDPAVEVPSGAAGQFSFANVPPGPFRLTVSLPGFADQTISGILAAGDISNLPPIRMTLALSALAVDVTATRVELAQRQIEQQEQQRILGVVPNFFVSYDPHALPLTAKQKFELTGKARLDPFQFGVVAIVAGVQQARNDYSGFGQGAEGYAKRYAALYATILTRSVLTQALLPSLFKQDPRYFHKGTGPWASRTVYALSSAVITKGDNGRWQPDYSGILGSLAAGALSNFYYPAEDRKGVQLTLENTAIGIASVAAGRLAQEFLFKKVTSHSGKSP